MSGTVYPPGPPSQEPIGFPEKKPPPTAPKPEKPDLSKLPPPPYTPTSPSPLTKKTSVLKDSSKENVLPEEGAQKSSKGIQKVMGKLGGILGIGKKKEETLSVEHLGAPKVEKKELTDLQDAFNALNALFREYNQVSDFFRNHPEASQLTTKELGLTGVLFVDKRAETKITTQFKKPIPEALKPTNKNLNYSRLLREKVAANEGQHLSAKEILDCWKHSFTDPDGKINQDVRELIEYTKENAPVDENRLKQQLESLKKEQTQLQFDLNSANEKIESATRDLKKAEEQLSQAKDERDKLEIRSDKAEVLLQSFTQGKNLGDEGAAKKAFEKAKEAYTEKLESSKTLEQTVIDLKKSLGEGEDDLAIINSNFIDLSEQKFKLETAFHKDASLKITAIEARIADLEDKIKALKVE